MEDQPNAIDSDVPQEASAPPLKEIEELVSVVVECDKGKIVRGAKFSFNAVFCVQTAALPENLKSETPNVEVFFVNFGEKKFFLFPSFSDLPLLRQVRLDEFRQENGIFKGSNL